MDDIHIRIDNKQGLTLFNFIKCFGVEFAGVKKLMCFLSDKRIISLWPAGEQWRY